MLVVNVKAKPEQGITLYMCKQMRRKESKMAHREEWSVVNYGQRGRRGYPGRGVTSIQLDSEGYL